MSTPNENITKCRQAVSGPISLLSMSEHCPQIGLHCIFVRQDQPTGTPLPHSSMTIELCSVNNRTGLSYVLGAYKSSFHVQVIIRSAWNFVWITSRKSSDLRSGHVSGISDPWVLYERNAFSVSMTMMSTSSSCCLNVSRRNDLGTLSMSLQFKR